MTCISLSRWAMVGPRCGPVASARAAAGRCWSAETAGQAGRSTPLAPEMGWLGDLRVDRGNPATVYAPAYFGFFESDDDGATWRSVSVGLESVIGGGSSTGLYAVFDEPGIEHTLLLGTAHGLYFRLHESAAWQQVTGEPFDAMRIDDLLILDAAEARTYVTTPMGVFVTTP
ncbi:MAG: hypothetical protein R2856_02010 [Caldilineaceae bacterium]